MNGNATVAVYKNLCQRWKFDTVASEHFVYNLISMSTIERKELLKMLVAENNKTDENIEISDAVCNLMINKRETSPLYLYLMARALKLEIACNNDTYDEAMAMATVEKFPDDITKAYDLALEDVENEIGEEKSNILLTSIWATEGDLFYHQIEKLLMLKQTFKGLKNVLDCILRQRYVGNTDLVKVNFVHMQARDAVQRRYLQDECARKKRHKVLGDFFLQLYTTATKDGDSIRSNSNTFASSNRNTTSNSAKFASYDPLHKHGAGKSHGAGTTLRWTQILRRLPVHLLHSGNKSSLEKLFPLNIFTFGVCDCANGKFCENSKKVSFLYILISPA